MNIWPELQCKTSQFSLFIFFEISKSKPLAICFVIRFSNVSLFKGVEERSTFLKLARWIHLWRQSSTAAFENPGGQHKQKFVSLLSSPHIFFQICGNKTCWSVKTCNENIRSYFAFWPIIGSADTDCEK